MVKLNSSSVFMKDPSDVWGKEHTIGNAELAARLGSPMSFDRRGTIFAYDDFESSPLKWNKISSGGAGSGQVVALSNSNYAYQGEFCMILQAPNVADDWVGAYRHFGGLAKHKIGVELTTVLGSEDFSKFVLGLHVFTGSRYIIAGVRLQQNTNTGLSYFHTGTNLYDDTNYTSFNTDFPLKIVTPYPLKFVVDVENEVYTRCMFGGTEIDMSSYTPYATDSTYAPYVRCELYAINDSGTTPGYWCDNFILTIEEPA